MNRYGGIYRGLGYRVANAYGWLTRAEGLSVRYRGDWVVEKYSYRIARGTR